MSNCFEEFDIVWSGTLNGLRHIYALCLIVHMNVSYDRREQIRQAIKKSIRSTYSSVFFSSVVTPAMAVMKYDTLAPAHIFNVAPVLIKTCPISLLEDWRHTYTTLVAQGASDSREPLEKYKAQINKEILRRQLTGIEPEAAYLIRFKFLGIYPPPDMQVAIDRGLKIAWEDL